MICSTDCLRLNTACAWLHVGLVVAGSGCGELIMASVYSGLMVAELVAWCGRYSVEYPCLVQGAAGVRSCW